MDEPPPWDGVDDELPSPDGLDELADGRKPDYPTEFASFKTTNPGFWDMGAPPIGSVMTITLESEDRDKAPCLVALLVISTTEREDGHWVQVKLLGCDQVWARAQVVSDFSRQKKHVHLCRAPLESGCLGVKGVHLETFGLWPPGKFKASYADPKKMAEMAKFLADLGVKEKGGPEGGEVGTTPERLAALRKRLFEARPEGAGLSKSVSFAPQEAPKGILRRKAPGEALVLKQERGPMVVSSDSEPEPRKEKKMRPSKEASVSQALYAAVERRQNEGKRSRESPSPDSCQEKKSKKSKKKKKKKKKKKGSSSGSSSDTTESDSSSDGLKPPLQKKAERRPGSVLKMLMDHVRLSLSDLSLGDADQEGAGSAVSTAARVQSYFQILVRPQLSNRPRDEKELYSLSLALDYLRQGQVTRVADLLAGRYMAVETAALEGSWETARWLEVARLEDRGATPAQVLLAARKHQKTIDRASGRGSYQYGTWPSGSYDAGHWQDAPGGLGKGRGKKGKGQKGKGKKGKKKAGWWDDPSAKDPEKAKPEAAK